MKWPPIVIIAALIWPLAAPAAQFSFESGPRQAVLLELYTSEGCNSCPPAEEYLNSFRTNPDLWKRYIPLAFHVDYWDYLGWKDRFARNEFSARQRTYGQWHRARTIYTPEFFANGQEWRRAWGTTPPAQSTDDVGTLVINVNDTRLSAMFSPAEGVGDKLVLHVAILGTGLTTDIRRGENAGRRAHHEFVVLGYGKAAGTGYRWNMPLPAAKTEGASRLAIAAWITRADSPIPIQSAGSWMP
jgi:hypothetical protein